MKNQEIVKLVTRMQAGDSSAFEELYNQTNRLVFYYCYKHIGDAQHAEDAVQEVYLKIFTRINDLKEPLAFNKWLSLFMADVTSKYYQKKSKIHEVKFDQIPETVPEDDDRYLPAELLENSESRNDIRDAVDSLPEKQREVVLMHYYQELSVNEICNVTGRSRNAVLNNLFLARKSIYTRLSIDANHEKERSKKKVMAFAPFLFLFFDTEAALLSAPYESIIWSTLTESLANISGGFLPAIPVAAAPAAITAAQSSVAAGAGLSGIAKIGITLGSSLLITSSVVGVVTFMNKDPLHNYPTAIPAAATNSAASEIVFEGREEQLMILLEDFATVNSIKEYDQFYRSNGFQSAFGENTGDSYTYYTSTFILCDGTPMTIGIRDDGNTISKAYEVGSPSSTVPSEWFDKAIILY
jgi:RNA polymerase sigma factor, sigma-70 family